MIFWNRNVYIILFFNKNMTRSELEALEDSLKHHMAILARTKENKNSQGVQSLTSIIRNLKVKISSLKEAQNE